ncbi:MAG: membrane protein insertase YidC [Thermodesulfobacteriota bacterium]
MEHVRLIVAILLSLAIFLAWDFFFVDRRPVPPPAPPTQTVAPETAKESTGQQQGQKPEQMPEEALQPVTEQTFDTITVDTGLYKAVISEKGATISRFELKEYRENADPDAPRKELIPQSNPAGTALVDLSGGNDPLYNAVFATDFEDRSLSVENGAETLSFFQRSDSGLVLEKRYTFYPDRYAIGLAVLLRNESDRIVDRNLEISMTNPTPEESRRFTFAGPVLYMDGKLNQVKPDDIAEKNTYNGNIQWTGLTDHYFMSALIPPSAVDTRVILDLDSRRNLLKTTFQQPMDPLAPGGVAQYDYHLFMGPKKLSLLRDFGHELDEIVDFGIFSVIAKPALWLMNAIHDNVIANYGVAIILLTLLIKAVFWPLGNKSYKSMGEMRKIQPLMMEIRNKYKDDKKKMNEEVMNLYKTYKINPLSGCLPMVVQIPVFIAFYRMLYEAIELRHAPFLLWINDLSAPDRLFDFGINIPLMAQPAGIPVLTLIMGATMFLQQKLAPPPGDPMQARIMMMLPIVFTFIFINFPAGLVLYWLVNNLVSIAQQYNVNRKMT